MLKNNNNGSNMSRYQYISDEAWESIAEYFPQQKGKRGFQSKISNRDACEAMLFRYRTGVPWRDLPEYYGKWSTIYQRFKRWCESGVIDNVFGLLQQLHGVNADFVGVDSTVIRAHRHAAGARKVEGEQSLGQSKGGTRQKYTPLVLTKIPPLTL
jgi:transposase